MTCRPTSTTRRRLRQLLQQAGLTLPVEIEFWYPTDVSRDYMPDPKRNFEAMAADLNAAGFKVTAKTAPWRPDYVSLVNAGNAGHLNLIGWIADFADADNFIGTFFQAPTDQWGFENPEIHDLLNRPRRSRIRPSGRSSTRRPTARSWPSPQASPTCTPSVALAFDSDIEGFVPSPVGVGGESFATVASVTATPTSEDTETEDDRGDRNHGQTEE